MPYALGVASRDRALAAGVKIIYIEMIRALENIHFLFMVVGTPSYNCTFMCVFGFVNTAGG